VVAELEELVEEKMLDASLATDDSVALLMSSPFTSVVVPLVLTTLELGEEALGVPLVVPLVAEVEGMLL